MKKILVIPNSKNVDIYLDKDIDGVILPLEHLAVNSECYFSIEDIKNICQKTDKEICVSINKVMENKDLALLEKCLITLSKMNVKVLFYDLSIVNINKRLGLGLDLVIYQDHLNVSIYTNLFYKNRGIGCSFISNDITMDEINEIGKVQSLMMMCYGYLPIFYSRRYLVSNYLSFLNREKKNSSYSIDEYRIVEEENGTAIYSKDCINLINDIDRLNIDYVVLNGSYINHDKFMDVIDKFVSCDKDDKDYYKGFLNKKTVYRVEDYE